MVGVVKDRYYWHDINGYNYRMTNICAAIGLGQLKIAKLRVVKQLQSLEGSEVQLDEEFENLMKSVVDSSRKIDSKTLH